jgi:hypothetical protein
LLSCSYELMCRRSSIPPNTTMWPPEYNAPPRPVGHRWRPLLRCPIAFPLYLNCRHHGASSSVSLPPLHRLKSSLHPACILLDRPLHRSRRRLLNRPALPVPMCYGAPLLQAVGCQPISPPTGIWAWPMRPIMQCKVLPFRLELF